MRPVVGMGVVTGRKRCEDLVRHAPDCVAMNRAEAAWNAKNTGLWRAWMTDIRRKACCRNLPPGEPRECGWAGEVEIEMTGGSSDVVETELWQCPRCCSDHVDEVQ